MAVHDLKCWPGFFKALRSGEKTFDIRKEDDRHFEPQDLLELREWNPRECRYTGAALAFQVSYTLRGADFGIAPGYVVLGLKTAPAAVVPDAEAIGHRLMHAGIVTLRVPDGLEMDFAVLGVTRRAWGTESSHLQSLDVTLRAHGAPREVQP